MTPRQRYLLDQAPGLLGTALDLESLGDDPYRVLAPAPDLDARAIARAIDLAGALYDQVMAADAIPVGAASSRDGVAANCPHQEIIALYHELLPLCPQVRTWTGNRAALLRARWRENPDLDWWRGYFKHVADSKFLTGRTETPGRRPFLADLEWLIRPANQAKVYEGKYHGV